MVALRNIAGNPESSGGKTGWTVNGRYVRPQLASVLRRDVAASFFCDELSRMFDLTECRNEDRAKVESFIGDAFTLAYGACIRNFMPRLLAVCRKNGDLMAAFGVRSAGDERLFLEQYLDRPIEHAIEAETGIALDRSQIAEVGNLAAIYPGGVRWMIAALTVMLYEEGYEWVVFTGTAALRNGFNKLGLFPAAICPAEVRRLNPREQAIWGNYYDNNPIVMFGNIRQGFEALRGNAHLLELLGSGKNGFFRELNFDRPQAANGND